jgi:hypothetical protein
MQDIISIFRENDIAFTIWGYRKKFGVFDDKGKVKDQRYLDALLT